MHTMSRSRAEHGFSWLAASFTVLTQLVLVGLAWIMIWQERARDRHGLASLDDRMLRDIGLSRADVDLEAGKPFWQA